MALRSRRLSAVALAALGLAGCGGGTAPGPRVAASPAPSAAPDPLYPKAKSCGIPVTVPFATPRDLRPFVPPPFVTTITSPSGAGFRNVMYVEQALGPVLGAIRREAQRRGHEITYTEQEPVDAEINVREPDGEVYAFRLLNLPRCPGAIQLTVIRLQG